MTMLDLESAIKHCEEVAEKQEITAKSNLMEPDKTKADGILRLYDADEYELCMKCAEEHRQLAEWLKELKQLREQTKWISCSEKLPEEGRNVLICINDGTKCGIYVSYRMDYNLWRGYGRMNNDCVAWMSLPEMYKKKDD